MPALLPAIVLLLSTTWGAVTFAEPAAPEPRIHFGGNAVPIAVAAIDAAERSVDAALYKFDEPSLLAAVERALQRGVRVRLLADETKANANSLVALAGKAGAEVKRWRAKRGKLHAKLMLVDGERAIAGSFNWTRSAARSNVELVLDFREPATVKRLAEGFEKLWDRGR